MAVTGEEIRKVMKVEILTLQRKTLFFKRHQGVFRAPLEHSRKRFLDALCFSPLLCHVSLQTTTLGISFTFFISEMSLSFKVSVPSWALSSTEEEKCTFSRQLSQTFNVTKWMLSFSTHDVMAIWILTFTSRDASLFLVLFMISSILCVGGRCKRMEQL